MRKRTGLFFLILLILTCVSACGRDELKGEYRYTIYYVNKEGTCVVSEEYATDTSAEDKEALLRELMNRMRDTSEKPEYLSPLSESFQDYTLNEGQMNMDFSEAYMRQEPIVEVLCSGGTHPDTDRRHRHDHLFGGE